MLLYYCNDPACPGHIKNWERCGDLKAFGRTQDCGRCASPRSVCTFCDRMSPSGPYASLRPGRS
ncbi:hypothetical protein [Desulfohalovibrio reitneri]|uniref:hypothetical protein n=1 Tax=Desulfohalovibrio reitneri TaxID=1307759 RepID=UPI0004A7630C|nr:hypothetical protein [Desulfohalovibrio reitneri]